MFHFLAKMGRSPWAQQATGALVVVGPVAYLTVHSFAHTTVRNFLIADEGHDRKASISESLQSLILTVNEDIKDVFNQSIIPEKYNKWSVAPPIKWFASCTLMPVTFGLTNSKQGVLIGLPSYLNYEKAENLPDYVFLMKKVKLFKERSSTGEESTNEDQPDPSMLNSTERKAEIVLRLDRNDPEVKEYANSLILSERAKKFVIARELFIADSARVFSVGATILISGLMALAISRAGVKALKLAEAHVTYRLPVYGIGGFAGMMNYNFLSDSINREYGLAADKKAATLNEDYMEGAKEFFEKTIKRNKALRDLVDDFKKVYDEKGNVKQPIIRFKHVPLDERLRLIRQEKVQFK